MKGYFFFALLAGFLSVSWLFDVEVDFILLSVWDVSLLQVECQKLCAQTRLKHTYH